MLSSYQRWQRILHLLSSPSVHVYTHVHIIFTSTYTYTDGYKYISQHCHETHGQLPGPLWSSERAPLQIHHICISWLLKLISRGQLNYYANPCILSTVSLIWICVYAYWEALISSSFNVSKAPDSFQRIILAVLTSLKCRSWFEKVLTSTICYFSLNNLHFKVNMAFIFEWISVCCQNWSQMSKKKMLVSYWTKMFSSTKEASKEEFLFLALDSFIKTTFSDIIKYPVMIALTKCSNN